MRATWTASARTLKRLTHHSAVLRLIACAECDGIIEAVGGKHGEYIRPSTTAKPVRQANGQVVLTDVPDQIRTSHNAWCQHRSCYDHPVHEAVIQRIMGIMQLPPNNAEHMQLLKYGTGEYYRLHHDWIPCLLYTSQSPRDGLLSRMPSSA